MRITDIKIAAGTIAVEAEFGFGGSYQTSRSWTYATVRDALRGDISEPSSANAAIQFVQIGDPAKNVGEQLRRRNALYVMRQYLRAIGLPTEDLREISSLECNDVSSKLPEMCTLEDVRREILVRAKSFAAAQINAAIA